MYFYYSFMHGCFSDINECIRGLDDCTENGTCINTPGSFDCVCKLKFTGDGYNCTGTILFSSTKQLLILAIFMLKPCLYTT